MKRLRIMGLTVTLGLVAVLVMAQSTPRPFASEKADPLDGLVYYKNPVTGKLAIYISYELQPGHNYAVSLTDDGVTYSEPYIKSTQGAVNDVYLSFTVDPCNATGAALWPRVVDLGPSPAVDPGAPSKP